MLCGLQLGLLVVGLIVLTSGRLVWSKKVEVRDDAARVIGGVLLAPIPLSILAGFLVVFLGFVPPPDLTQAGLREYQMIALLLDGTILVGCLVLAAFLFHAWADAPPAAPRPEPARTEIDPAAEVPLPPSTDDVDFVALALEEVGIDPRSLPAEASREDEALQRERPGRRASPPPEHRAPAPPGRPLRLEEEGPLPLRDITQKRRGLTVDEAAFLTLFPAILWAALAVAFLFRRA